MRASTPTTDPTDPNASTEATDTTRGATVTTTATAADTDDRGTASRPVYRLTAVSKKYQQGKRTVTALSDVDLVIPAGQLVAIQGPTGGGKSTLLQVLGALDRPSAGSVELAGRDVATLGDRALTDLRATEIGFVFQGFNLIPTLTALENVETAFAGSLAKQSRQEVRRRATEALREVGLGERLDHLPAELSGGQQQRVAIARALVKDPRVLLADEPTGALDEGTRDEIMAIIERQWRDRGLTVVIVTHDSWVAGRAERRLLLQQGQVRELTTRP
ncbi:ABC transporter ATP-binding protein [Curtobacterium sp. VKM Ac-1395]|uniref:ABC transporter ATP-binding protein n=1 Tax=Curtobacterium sp. VKM Ac-1395 TaxID=2783815 RepID=UPI00188D4F64|nr:ABC transporter ATP-binding protein [Curtobacterium sp. VKM Ac-1395]MBF4591308.1 ABC transporter ATP-binding protein [Curtobacterium sp. VKM Ac-1395]